MKRLIGWTVSAAVAVLFLLPLLWMVTASFRPEAAIFQRGLSGLLSLSGGTFGHYAAAWRRAELAGGLLNSVLQVTGVIALGLVINSAAAYAFARLRFRGRDALFTAVVILIILPVEVLVVPLFLVARDLGMTGGYGVTVTALILPFAAKAFNIYFLRQHFLSLPTELEEAARVDGAGLFRIYWNVALPSIRPALATVAVLDLLTHWSDFIWPLVICTREETRTVQLCLANLFTQPPIRWGDILACAVLVTLPVVAFFRLAQRHLVTSDYAAGIK